MLKRPLWVKKNHAVISDSSLLGMFLKIAASLDLTIPENTCEEVCLQQGCQG